MSALYDVSFIIPCYNIAEWIEGCVFSIKSQKLEKQGLTYEILLIDDCSTDDTKQCIEAIVHNNAHCVAVHLDENRGISGVRNHGIQIARGEYIWFVDGDDCLYPQSAGHMVAKQYDADKCFGNYYEVNFDYPLDTIPPIINIETAEIQHGRNTIYSAQNQYGANAAAVWCGVWKRSFLLNNALYFNEDIRMTEDLLFNFQSEYKERYVVKVNIPCYIYRVGRASATQSHNLAARKRDYESCVKLVNIFSSYLDVDNSEKLKYRIDEKKRDCILSLMSIPDTRYTKKELAALKAKGLFPPKYYYAINTKGMNSIGRIRYFLMDNVTNSIQFWILHYIKKANTILKARKK